MKIFTACLFAAFLIICAGVWYFWAHVGWISLIIGASLYLPLVSALSFIAGFTAGFAGMKAEDILEETEREEPEAFVEIKTESERGPVIGRVGDVEIAEWVRFKSEEHDVKLFFEGVVDDTWLAPSDVWCFVDKDIVLYMERE